MKKLITLASFVLLANLLSAQQSNFSESINHLFEHLDFSEVTTGLLLQHAIPFAKVDSFDGTELTEFNKMDVDKFGVSPYVKVCLFRKSDVQNLTRTIINHNLPTQ